MKHRLLAGALLFVVLPLNALILNEKIEVNKRISKANAYILTKQLDDAEAILTEIKYEYADTEFAPMAEFLLSTIYYERKEYFKAQFAIEQTLAHPDYPRLPSSYADRIAYFRGMIHYKLEHFQTAYDILKNLNVKKNLPTDKINLAMADILVKQNTPEQAKYCFTQINERRLTGYDVDLYNYLADKILWQSIDTTAIAYKDPNVSAILVDKDILYIGTWNGSLIRYNYILGESGYFTRSELINENIRTLYNDGRHIYVGTQEGLSVLDKRNRSWSSPNELKGISITSVCRYQNKIFIGTLGSGVIVYDTAAGTFSNDSKETLTNVVGLNPIGQTLYICTYSGGVYRYDDGSFIRENALSQRENPVTRIIELNQELWLATYGRGIIRYNPKTKKSTVYNKKNAAIPDDFILCAANYHDKIFFGTLGKGIFIYNGETDGWEPFRFSDKYFGLDINTLEIYNNSIFIGTLGEGVLIRSLFE